MSATASAAERTILLIIASSASAPLRHYRAFNAAVSASRVAQRRQYRRRSAGRTPRHRKKDSAACSTSMPRPSDGARGAIRERSMRETAWRARHTPCRRRARRAAKTSGGKRRHASTRLADVALMTRSNASPATSYEPPPAAHAGRMRRESRRERLRLGRRPIGDRDARRPLGEQRQQRTARRTARAHQQHALARDVEPEVLANVANEPGAIGVVADDAFAVEFERIDGARLRRPLAALRGKLERVELERHRHVEPASAGLPKAPSRHRRSGRAGRESSRTRRLRGARARTSHGCAATGCARPDCR